MADPSPIVHPEGSGPPSPSGADPGTVPGAAGSGAPVAGGSGPRAPRRPGLLRRGPRGLSGMLQRSIVLGAALAMVLFGAPLAVAVKGLYRAQGFANLAGDAERAHAVITAKLATSQGRSVTVQLPAPHTEHASVAVYDNHGVLLGGSGPSEPESVVRAAISTGLEDEAVIHDQIVVAVPVASTDDESAFVVRASAPYGELRARTYATWAVMAGLGVIVLVVVGGVGRARARRVARPLQSLAAAADALGHGDFSVRAVHAGVVEIDAVSDNLERTARRLGGMLERERSFTADASHQMRTPLTAVRVGLESAMLTPGADLHAAVEDALVGLDRLEQTVLDLLAVARDTSGPRQRTDVAVLTQEVAGHWARTLGEHHRELRLDLEPDLPAAAVSQPALRTVLDVLLDNALTHGAGRVAVRVRATDATVLLQVEDEGPGVTGDPSRIFARRSAEARGTGIGLALARSLVEADGGRLELTRVAPATFAVLLPAAPDLPDGAGPDGARSGGDIGGTADSPTADPAPGRAGAGTGNGGGGAGGGGTGQLVRPGTTRTPGS